MLGGAARIERRLAAVRAEVRSLREQLGVLGEQLVHVEGEAAEVATRAVVDGSPLAQRERERAEGDAWRVRRARDEVAGQVAALEREMDDLLDRLITSDRR